MQILHKAQAQQYAFLTDAASESTKTMRNANLSWLFLSHNREEQRKGSSLMAEHRNDTKNTCQKDDDSNVDDDDDGI